MEGDEVEQLRLLTQIANGLLAAHARIDVLEQRLLTAASSGASKAVTSEAAVINRRLDEQAAKSAKELSELRKVVSEQGNSIQTYLTTQSSRTDSQHLTLRKTIDSGVDAVKTGIRNTSKQIVDGVLHSVDNGINDTINIIRALHVTLYKMLGVIIFLLIVATWGIYTR
jgi:hypothetical protein